MYPETGNNDCKIYVGNLPDDVRVRDIEDLFYKYGKIVDIDLHDRPRKGPPFSFVEFEDERDAEDAVRGRDGYDFDGYRIRVEFPRLSSKGGGYPQRRGGGRGSMPMRDRGGMRKGFQCLVTNLPPTGSWQDLKDHFREAGDVTFTDVFRDGTGIVEFARYDHMKRAVRDLDDSKFRSHEGETAYINVKRAGRSPSRSRSRSPRRRSRSPRYSRSRSRSSRSRSRSRSRNQSRSPRRFRSRSPRHSRSRSRS